MWKAKNNIGREIPGIILGLVFSGILFGIVYYLSSFSFGGAAFFGTGGAVLALFGYGFFAYLYTTNGWSRRYDAVIGMAFLGAVLFLIVEEFIPVGGILVNLSTTTVGFLVTVLYGLIVATFIISGFATTKIKELR